MKSTIKNDITYDQVLQTLNGGYDGYMYYYGSTPKICKRPWGRDKHPSFGFFSRDGIWFWKDIAKEESGTLVQFVMKMFNLTYSEAIEKIKWDFGIGTTNIQAVKKTWDDPKVKDKPALIFTETIPFEQRHIDFWSKVGITETQCNKYGCYAVGKVAINRQIYPIRSNEAVFTYRTNNGQEKVYFPERNGQRRFRNNVGYFHIWNINNIEPCDKLIVIKSMKDLITVSQFYPCIVATQNESVELFSPEVVEKLNSLAKEIYIWFGTDDDGKSKSIKITKKLGWKWLNTPNKFLPANDPYEVASKYGIEEIEKHLKLKGFI